MGDKKLNQSKWFIVPWLVVTIVSIVVISILWQPETDPQPSPVEPVSKTIIVMKASPVDNEPGAYILEYSNGVKEVLHADGTREILKFGKVEGY